jgi:hypothetical protein
MEMPTELQYHKSREPNKSEQGNKINKAET